MTELQLPIETPQPVITPPSHLLGGYVAMIGDVVLYSLTADDVQRIVDRAGASGLYVGRYVPGDLAPGMVVRTVPGSVVLVVHLDASFVYRVGKATEGTQPGQYRVHPRTVAPAQALR